MMPLLILFDVDGTLVHASGAGRRALDSAFFDILGIESAMSGLRLDGGTDRGILRTVFDRYVALDPTSDLKEDHHRASAEARVIEAYLGFLVDEIARLGDRYEVLRGVRALLDALHRSEGCILGLATGNIEAGARIKLEPAGLLHYFSCGGFGGAVEHRAALVEEAIARGQEVAESRFKERNKIDPSEVVVIGDTEKDVAAARAVGARSIGVLSGCRMPEALAASEPDLLADSLEDDAVWSMLGVTKS